MTIFALCPKQLCQYYQHFVTAAAISIITVIIIIASGGCSCHCCCYNSQLLLILLQLFIYFCSVCFHLMLHVYVVFKLLLSVVLIKIISSNIVGLLINSLSLTLNCREPCVASLVLIRFDCPQY